MLHVTAESGGVSAAYAAGKWVWGKNHANGHGNKETAEGVNSSNCRYRKLAKFPFPLLSTASLRVIG